MMPHINKALKKNLPKTTQMRQGQMFLGQLGDGEVWPELLRKPPSCSLSFQSRGFAEKALSSPGLPKESVPVLLTKPVL